MKKGSDDFLDNALLIASELYAVGEPVAKLTLKKYLGDIFGTVSKLKNERFLNRCMIYFDYDKKYISEAEREDFFKNITGKQKELMVSLIEKVYNADYDLHVCLYKFLAERLMKNKTFDFYDHTLYANMHQCTSLDFEALWYQVKSDISVQEIGIDKINPISNIGVHSIIETDYLSIKKFLSIGVLQEGDRNSIRQFKINEYTKNIFYQLDKCIDNETKEQIIELRKFRKYE